MAEQMMLKAFCLLSSCFETKCAMAYPPAGGDRIRYIVLVLFGNHLVTAVFIYLNHICRRGTAMIIGVNLS
ncbi:hypothetical protein NIES4074_42530 [Cylindrospermum sp. NIES-4074]|nr:hypothetical protein NIES4074_42530 [Cylindrospermum sp. NIES-4074]